MEGTSADDEALVRALLAFEGEGMAKSAIPNIDVVAGETGAGHRRAGHELEEQARGLVQ